MPGYINSRQTFAQFSPSAAQMPMQQFGLNMTPPFSPGELNALGGLGDHGVPDAPPIANDGSGGIGGGVQPVLGGDVPMVPWSNITNPWGTPGMFSNIPPFKTDNPGSFWGNTQGWSSVYGGSQLTGSGGVMPIWGNMGTTGVVTGRPQSIG